MKSGYEFAALLVAIIALGAARQAEAQMAHLTLQSEPGEFIGLGQNYDLIYTPSNSSLSAVVMRTLPSGEASELLFVLSGDQTIPFSRLFFSTDALGIPIQPGVFLDAQRFAQPGHPGLDVSLVNRGCNTLFGNFTISQVSFGPDNSIQSFAASFEQHCEGQIPALFGTFTYNAVPEPSTLSLFACVAVVAILAWHKPQRGTAATEGLG